MRYVPEIIANLYNLSPTWTRTFSSNIYGILKQKKENNKLFYKFFNELKYSQWWSIEKLKEFQYERLKRLISYSVKHVPYYRKIFAEYGIISSQIQTQEDLKRLPKLTKEIIKKERYNLFSDEYDIARLRAESTSGTTGSPLIVWLDDRTYLYTKAIQKLQHSWAGRRADDWIGVLAGYKVIHISRKNPPFWVKNYITKQIHFSSYHLNIKNVNSYFKALKKSKVKFLMGYPSTIGLFAKLINTYIQEPIQLKGVFTSSEPIYYWQRLEIKKAFHCKIYDRYGQTESVANAMNCKQTNNLHIIMESSIIELDKVTDNQFKIIGTTLVNYAMPLIRYEVNDVTGGFVKEECSCGRKHYLIKPIETKIEDFVVTSEGNIISPSILTFPFKAPKGIIESQIIQKELDVLLIKLVTDNKFDKEQETELLNNISKCVGNNMKIFIEKVNKIPRTKNGKFRFVVSNIKNKKLFDDILNVKDGD
ncbi:MAG: phenylacetate--CoA ligase family protein [Promethearchaeota archaeon]